MEAQEAKIDRLPVSQLFARYGIARSVLYDRFNALGVVPERRGNKAFVNALQLELLDNLHSHLSSGGTTLDFLERNGLLPQSSADEDKGNKSGQLVTTEEDVPFLFSRLVEALALSLARSQPDSFAKFRVLEEACQNRWLLSTSHLAELLSLSVGTLSSRQSFERYGFIFTKCGKNGTQAAWRITKPAD